MTKANLSSGALGSLRRNTSVSMPGRDRRFGTCAAVEIQKVLPRMVSALATRATLANRLAKSTTGQARQCFYEQKTAALCQLIRVGAGQIEEVLFTRGLVTVAIPNGRRLHMPIRPMPPDIRARVLTAIQQHTIAA